MFSGLPTQSRKKKILKDDRSSYDVYSVQKENARLRAEKEKRARERRRLKEARKRGIHVTPGLEEDILKLKAEFQLSPDHNMRSFKAAVAKTKFNFIYDGIKTYRECLQSVEKIINHAKFIWLEAKSFSDAVFGFYVLSLVYYIQPVVDAVKIRLSVKEMDLVFNFLVLVMEADNLEVACLFNKMKNDAAFLPCLEKDVKVFHNTTAVKPTMPELSLPSSLVDATKQFMETINKYKARRAASSTLCPGHIVSNNKLDYDFIAEFLNPNMARKETQPPETDVATDTDIGERRRALKAKSFKFFPGKGQEQRNVMERNEESKSESGSDSDELEWLSSLNLSEKRKHCSEDQGSEQCASSSGTQVAKNSQGTHLSCSGSDTDTSLPEIQLKSGSQFEYTSGASDSAHSATNVGRDTTVSVENSSSMPLINQDDTQESSDGMISVLP